MPTVNIKTLAKKMGVSVSTVSRALRDSKEISKETKQRVLEMAQKLNYIPNANASGLRSKVNKTIGVIIPEVSEIFFSLAINGIEAIAQEKGYHVLIYLTHESFEKEQAVMKEFQNGRVDGVIISVSSQTTDPAHILEFQKKGMPVVLFDRVMSGVNAAKITTDDFKITYEATVHLIENGCKRVAFLPFTTGIDLIKERLKGYKKALKDKGISYDKSLVVVCNKGEETDYKLVKNLLKNERPDGVIATAARLSRFTYLASYDLNLSIPQDLKVVAFSNVQSAPLFNPSLTTITQPAYKMGVEAANILFKALENEGEDVSEFKLVIPSIMFLRNSSINM